jgi:hypothetical protein
MSTSAEKVQRIMGMVESYAVYRIDAHDHGNKFGDVDGASSRWIELYNEVSRHIGRWEDIGRWQELEVRECKKHPNAPHGFLRNASHNEGRYVCQCEHWEEPK